MKTSDLTGAQLDFWVAKAEGWIETKSAFNKYALWDTGGGFYRVAGPLGESGDERWSPSTNWSQGGPIIEREKISPSYDSFAEPEAWSVASRNGAVTWGETMLIAAMRAYVASKFGEEVVDNP